MKTLIFLFGVVISIVMTPATELLAYDLNFFYSTNTTPLDTSYSIISLDKALCEMDSALLVVPDIYDSYQWNNNSNLDKNELYVHDNGTYTIEVTSIENGETCTVRDTIVVTTSFVKGGVYAMELDENICIGDSIVLIAYGGGSQSSAYAWETPQGQIISDTLVVFPDTTSNYTVTVTNSKGCQETYTTTVSVDTFPIAEMVLSDTLICEGEQIEISVTDSPNWSYEWSTGAKTSSISPITSINHETYSVIVSSQQGCSIVLESESIKISESSTIASISGDENVDPDESGTYNISGLTTNDLCPLDSIGWTVNGETVPGDDLTNEILFDGYDDQTYVTVCAQIIDTCLCDNPLICMEVDIRTDEACNGVLRSSANSSCLGSQVTFEGFSNSGNGSNNFFESSNWYINEVLIVGTPNTAQFEVKKNDSGTGFKDGVLDVTFKIAGDYIIRWEFDYDKEGTGCIRSRELIHRVHELPNLSFESFLKNACVHEDIIVPLDNLPDLPFDYEYTYSIDGAQTKKTLSQNEPEYIKISNIDKAFDYESLSLLDKNTGCINLELSTNLNFSADVYFDVVIDSTHEDCFSDDAYEFVLYTSQGSDELSLTGNGQMQMSSFKTNPIEVDDNSVIFIEDEKCPSFNSVYLVDVLCECKEQAAELATGALEPVCSSEKVVIDVLTPAVVPNAELNVLYYDIYNNATSEWVKTVILEESPSDFIEIEYDPLFEHAESYKVISGISRKDGQEIDTTYACRNISINGPIFSFYLDPSPKIEGPDEVCLNQKDVVFTAHLEHSISVASWESSSDVELETLSTQHVSADFSTSGITEITLIEKFKIINSSDEKSCFGDVSKSVLVTEEEALEKVNVNLFPGYILVCEDDPTYCYQWYRVEKLTGITEELPCNTKVCANPDNAGPGEPGIDIESYVYYCETKVCGSDCVTYNFYNSNGPIILETETEQEESIKVYPNPTYNKIIVSGAIDFSKDKLSIVDLVGRSLEIEVNRLNKDSVEITWNQNISGMYTLLYQDNGKLEWARKVMILGDR